MKVAVTGGTGFVGSRLVEQLEATGAQTVLLTRNAQKALLQFPADVYKNVSIVEYDSLTSGDWQAQISLYIRQGQLSPDVPERRPVFHV